MFSELSWILSIVVIFIACSISFGIGFYYGFKIGKFSGTWEVLNNQKQEQERKQKQKQEIYDVEILSN